MNTAATSDEINAIPAHLDEFFIAGEWQEAATNARATVISPNDESIIAEVADPAPQDVERAIAAARTAFDSGPWPRMSLAERVVIIRRFTEALLRRVPEIGTIWAMECGPTKAYRDAINTIVAPTVYEDTIQIAESLPEVERRTGFAGEVELYREPFGVVVSILTYNGPLAYVGQKVLPPLLLGNTLILKLPAETRLVAQHIGAAAEEAEFPRGVISVLPADREASQYLVEHPAVDMVSFTGGGTVGSKILHSTADRIVNTTLELGGKSAGIIADDMPTEEVLPMLLPGLLPFQGQVCVALTRLLVPRARQDEIVRGLASIFESVTIGSALDPNADFGPVAVSRTRDRCEQYVEGAIAEGATLASGGKRPAHLDKGYYYEPTLLCDVDNKMKIARDEVFGPVFCVLPYDSMDDAVSIANDSDYGLTGAIYTHDTDLARSVGRRIQAGTFTMNSSGGVLGQAFGGYKQSGIGREMGLEGLLEYSQLKVMKINGSGSYL